MKQITHLKKNGQLDHSVFYTFKTSSKSSKFGSIRVAIMHSKQMIRFVIPGLNHLDANIWCNNSINASHPDSQLIIKRLRRFEQDCREAFNEIQQKHYQDGSTLKTADGLPYNPIRSLAFVKEYIIDKKKPFSGEMYMHEHFGEFIEEYSLSRSNAGRILRKTTIRQYVIIKKRLQEFEEKYSRITFKDFQFLSNSNIPYRFIQWLTSEKKYMDSSINKAKKQLNTFLDFARKKGIVNEQLIKFTYSNAESLSQTKAYLTENELEKLHAMNNLSGREELVRKIFLISCWWGLSYSDLQQISHLCQSEELIQECFRLKTNTRSLVLRFDQIIEFLNYFRINPLPSLISNTNNNSKYNAILKQVFEKAGLDRVVPHHKNNVKLFEYASSHLGRSTFINTLYKDNVPTEYLQKLSGHKSESVFKSYLQPTAEDILKASFNKSNRSYLSGESIPTNQLNTEQFLEQQTMMNILKGMMQNSM